MSFALVPILGILAILLLGWLLPLIIGIVRTRRGRRSIGMIVFGGVWGLISLCCIGLLLIGFLFVRRWSEEKKTEVFDPATYDGEMASITVPFKGHTKINVRVDDTSRQMELAGTNGFILAPAQQLTPRYCTFSAKDENGAQWTARTFISATARYRLELQDGETQHLDIGPPFTARVQTKKQGDGRYAMSLVTKGRGGQSFTLTSRGKQSPAFEVVNKQGQVVWKGTFEYG